MAAFLEGINPPSKVSTTLKRISTIAGAIGLIFFAFYKKYAVEHIKLFHSL